MRDVIQKILKNDVEPNQEKSTEFFGQKQSSTLLEFEHRHIKLPRR